MFEPDFCKSRDRDRSITTSDPDRSYVKSDNKQSFDTVHDVIEEEQEEVLTEERTDIHTPDVHRGFHDYKDVFDHYRNENSISLDDIEENKTTRTSSYKLKTQESVLHDNNNEVSYAKQQSIHCPIETDL